MCDTLGATKICGPISIARAVRKLGKVSEDQKRSAVFDFLFNDCHSEVRFYDGANIWNFFPDDANIRKKFSKNLLFVTA